MSNLGHSNHSTNWRRWLRCLCVLGTLFAGKQSLYAQSSEEAVDIDFLFHYYEQDGNHSAVTGGIGTEELSDIASNIIVNIPLDSVRRFGIHTHVNHYSSASTDNIDSYISSASSVDNHFTLNLEYEKTFSDGHQSLGGNVGGGLESDYISTSFGASWWRENAESSRSLTVTAKAYLDTWIVIFPEELRAPGLVSVPTNKRRSFHVSASWAQVVNPRLQTALTLETVFQQGLLSTPFHRVYFGDLVELPTIERLPMMRWKIPLGIRAHYFANDWLVLRGSYRMYWDSFSIFGQTLSADIPIKFSPFFSVYPFYRFHFQTAARYFAPHGEHLETAEFYSSDYDLSGFVSHKFGLGLNYAPLNGIFSFRTSPQGATNTLRQLNMRGGYYLRSDGLRAWTVSLGFGIRR
ncbi:MAG: DUF3570 domain-containing protein [Bacteroidota bacterium]